jgi:hypothetical protein
MASKPVVERFQEPADHVFAAAQAAAQQSAKTIDSIDPGARTIYFNTGMSMSSWNGQNVTATVADDPAGGSTLTVTAQVARRGLSSFQLVSWGEGNRVARKFVAGVRSRLAQPAQGV